MLFSWIGTDETSLAVGLLEDNLQLRNIKIRLREYQKEIIISVFLFNELYEVEEILDVQVIPSNGKKTFAYKSDNFLFKKTKSNPSPEANKTESSFTLPHRPSDIHYYTLSTPFSIGQRVENASTTTS